MKRVWDVMIQMGKESSRSRQVEGLQREAARRRKALLDEGQHGPFGFWWWNDVELEKGDGRRQANIFRFRDVGCEEEWEVSSIQGNSEAQFKFDPKGGEDGTGSVVFEGELKGSEADSDSSIVTKSMAIVKLRHELSPPLNIADFGSIHMRYKGDGRTYLLQAMDDGLFGDDNFQQATLPSQPREWMKVELKPYDFTSLRSSSSLRQAQVGLNYSCISMFSFGIVSNTTGPFRLEIDEFKAMGAGMNDGWESEELVEDVKWGKDYFMEEEFVPPQNEDKDSKK